jgi:flagellin
MRINSASDDAAGVAIASRLSSEIRGTNQAIRNALDGQAVIDSAEGAHKEIEAILQRMREVAVQAANDTNSADDRANLQAELDAMNTEIDRIASVTTWAGKNLMKDANTTISLQVGTATGTKNQIDVSIGSMSTATLGTTQTGSVVNFAADGTSNPSQALVDITTANMTTAGNASRNSAVLTIDHSKATAHKVEIAGVVIAQTTSAATTATARQADAVGLAALINANTTLASKGITATALADDGSNSKVAVHMGADNIQSKEAAKASITAIDAAIKTVNTQRSELGAVSNRLSHTVANMTNISANLSAAKGGIEDADFAVETTELAKNQILQQASTAMLAQANASKQNVLSLLQG